MTARPAPTLPESKVAPAPDDERGSQSIGRALHLLEEIAEHDAPRSLSELARANGLTTPTAHRILAALEQRRLVVRDPLSAEYSLGPAVLHLARRRVTPGCRRRSGVYGPGAHAPAA